MGSTSNYHQLRRAVSFANFGKLRFKTEAEQDLWSECSRLITNCLIDYNATLLSKVLERREREGDLEGVKALTGVSPVAWQHINFAGRYEFGRTLHGIDLDAVTTELR